jgi:hypothetical protein
VNHPALNPEKNVLVWPSLVTGGAHKQTIRPDEIVEKHVDEILALVLSDEGLRNEVSFVFIKYHSLIYL